MCIYYIYYKLYLHFINNSVCYISTQLYIISRATFVTEI